MLEKILNEKIIDIIFDIDKRFSNEINLFDYQIKALENTIKFLNLAFENNKFNKEKIFSIYEEENINLETLKLNDLQIGENYLSEMLIGKKQKEIPFKELVNRCSFWMATGSGKSLVMIKLIEILYKLMQNKKISKNNILILAPTDEILTQIENHIRIYNSFHTSLPIEFRNLKEFDGKIANNKNKIVIYYYRSNNIVDSETKEKELNFMEFYNNGKWYLILDEAHKGETSNNLSKRKAIFTLIAKQGIIFNFSATFSDELDKVTTIFDFKLDKFLRSGYGKKLMLMDSSVSVENENLLESIAKSLIILAQMRKEYEKIKEYGEYYHSPLMMTIANRVNTENADLKKFFEKLALIAEGKFDFKKIKKELNEEIDKNYLFGLGKLNKKINISEEEFYKYVFNASNPAKLEYAYSKNKNELVFKSKNSEKYFMLIYAGEIIKWSDSFLKDYNSLQTIDDNFFKELDKKEDISILLGSRMFIEGWDTNRVNIINFVELGKSDAEKLVLQAIGRGVRIEPIKNKRKRILELDDNDKKLIKPFEKIVKLRDFIETLFIFPSKKEYIDKILKELEKVSDKIECKNFRWYDEEIKTNEDFICVPIWEKGNKFNDKPFYISKNSQNELENYIKKFDDKTFILKQDIKTRTLKMIKEKNFYKSKKYMPVNELIKTLDNFWNEKIYEFKGIKLLTEEIIHYQKMCAILSEKEIEELENDLRKIKENLRCPDNKEEKEKLEKALEVNKELGIDTSKIEEKLQSLNTSKFIPELLECKIIKEHFYIPLLHTPYYLFNEIRKNKNNKTKIEKIKEKIQIFSHIIKNESEIEFLKDLEKYLQKDNQLKNYDKWMFSKIEENIDKIKIPYFDSEKSCYRDFYPDFIFWLKKDNKKYIIFIDPKGIEHTKNARDKIIGFLNLKNKIKDIEIRLFFYNQEEPDSEFKEYWCDDFDEIFKL